MTMTEDRLLDDRQKGILAEIEQAGGRELSSRTDELIGELLGDIQDKAVAEVLGGRVVEGVIITGDGCRFGPPIELPIPRFTPPNPPFDECRCTVAEFHKGKPDEEEARQIHELLLSINHGGNTIGVIGEVLRELCEGGLFNSRAGFLNGETFEPFFAEHHWVDQAGSRLFAQMLDEIWGMVELNNLLCEVGQGRKSISDLERNPRHGSLMTSVRRALVKS